MMETYILNGYDPYPPYSWDGMNGTNSVPAALNGTNSVMPMNGTNSVVPMQGTYGMYQVAPLAMMNYDEVPLNGIPDDYDERDINAYRLAYMVGDPDALNGLFGKLKSKIKQAIAGNQDARNNRRADRQERQDERGENRAIRQQKRADGTSFLDRFGGAISNVGEALKMKLSSANQLADMGVDYDEDVLDQRAMMSADAGGNSMMYKDGADESIGFFDRAMMWWQARSTGEKVLIGVGTGVTLYGAWYLYKKSKRKKGGRK